MIYFDNGATTLSKPRQVGEAMLHALNHYGNPSRGTYPASVNALKAVLEGREKVCSFFNVGHSSQVAFTANITESLNICAELLVKKGDRIITTIMEHNSVLRPLYKNGAEVCMIGFDEEGTLDYQAMAQELKKGAKAVFCSHGSNLTGDLVNIEKIGQLCKEHDAFFVLDTAQTAGVFDIDMQKCGIDFLCFTGHKSLFGPQGIGGICVRQGIAVTPTKVGGSGIHSFEKKHPAEMPAALEAGTHATPCICGLAAGIEFIQAEGLEKIRTHELRLMQQLYDGIRDLQPIQIYGNFKAAQRGPIVTFNLKGVDSGAVAEELWSRGKIAVRSGAHCAPRFHEYLGTQKQGAVRMSLSYFNTEEEVERAIAIIREISAEV